MKSKITGLYMAKYDGRLFPYGYTFDLVEEGELTLGIISQLQPQGSATILNPAQVEYILRVCGDKYDMDNGVLLEMTWFKYGFTTLFPCLTLDYKHILNYMDIPTYVIDIDEDIRVDKQQWLTYLDSSSMYFQQLYPDIPFENNWSQYDLTAICHNNILRYNKSNNTSTSNIKSFGTDTKDDYNYQDIMQQHAKETPEEKQPEVIEEVRPLEYDRNLPRLVIPRQTPPPNFKLLLKLMTNIQKTYGTCMSLSGLKDYRVKLGVAVQQYENRFREEFHLDDINPQARLFSNEHIHFIILKAVGEDPFEYKSKKYISFPKPKRKELLDKLLLTKGEDSYEYKLMKDYDDYLNIISGPLQIGKPILDSAYGITVPGVDNEIVEEDDVIKFFCGMELVKTNRVTTNHPNFQGQPASIKTFIRGRKSNRKILSIDIKAQEVMILIFGILENERLKNLVLKNKDPYKSFAICAGLCDENSFTPELKKLVKVPILSVMNGKSERNIRAELYDNLHVADTILSLITDDSGYKKIVARAREEQRKCYSSNSYSVVRKGLFGTESCSGERTGSAYTQSINANFQMTASELLCYGLTCMILDLNEKTNKYGLSIEQLTPLISIYDEVVFEYDEEIEEQAIDLVNFYICSQVEGWLEMSGSITTGYNYIYKE